MASLNNPFASAFSLPATPQYNDVIRRENIANKLKGNDKYVENSGFLGALGQALAGSGYGYQSSMAAGEAQQGQDSARQALAKALSGGYSSIQDDPSAYVNAASNPFLPPAAATAAGSYVGQQGQMAQQSAENQALMERQQQQQQFDLNKPIPIGWGTTGFMVPATGKATPVDYGDGQVNGQLSPETLDMIASQYLAGDKSVISGYARNPAMRAQIANAISAKASGMGMDGREIAAQMSAYGGNVAAQRAAGTRAAQVGIASSEANQMADLALDSSKKVPRGSFVPWNQAMNAVATGTSSPELAQFVAATTSLVNAYARAVSPVGTPTDSQRQHAYEMLNTAQGPEAYAAVIDQMKKEMQAALDAPAEISESLKTNITGAPSGTAPASAATPQGYTVLSVE